MVRSDSTGDSNPAAPRHNSLPTLKGVHPSGRDAVLKPLDPQGQPMEVREPWRAVRAEPMHLREEPVRVRKERVRLRGEPARWQEQPTGLRTAATWPRLEVTGLARVASAAPSLPWIAAGCAY